MTRLIFMIIIGGLLIALSGCTPNKDLEVNELPIEKPNSIYNDVDKDIDGDGIKDSIDLYYDGLDVILEVNEIKKIVFVLDSVEQIQGTNQNDTYSCDLLVSGNKIIVGITYVYTNKYGSTAWIYGYEYSNSQLVQVWTSDQILGEKGRFNSLDKDTLVLNVSVGDNTKEMVLDTEEASSYLDYIVIRLENEGYIPNIDFRHIPLYRFYDIDEDGEKEVVMRVIVLCGSSPLSDSYNSVYKIYDDGIREADGWFDSTRDEISWDWFLEQ